MWPLTTSCVRAWELCTIILPASETFDRNVQRIALVEQVADVWRWDKSSAAANLAIACRRRRFATLFTPNGNEMSREIALALLIAMAPQSRIVADDEAHHVCSWCLSSPSRRKVTTISMHLYARNFNRACLHLHARWLSSTDPQPNTQPASPEHYIHQPHISSSRYHRLAARRSDYHRVKRVSTFHTNER